MNTGKIQVLILSPQLLFRLGVELALSSVEDMKAASADEFNDGVPFAIDELPPDVVILDIDAPSENGLEVASYIKQRLPSIGIIMLTYNLDDTHLFHALKARAAACLDKDLTADQLIDTVRRVARGEHPINECLTARPQVAEHVLHQFQELSKQYDTYSVISPLTPRETEILNYMTQGFLNKQIAINLGISEQTIKNHVTSILRKLNANARTDAVVIAIKQGLVSLD